MPSRRGAEPSSPKLELAAVVATGGLHCVFEEVFDLKIAFIGVAAVFWFAYLGHRVREDRSVLAAWGFTRKRLGASFRAGSVLFVAGAALLCAVAALRGTLAFGWHLWVIFALYPIWGLVQQFLLQSLLARNLAALGGAFASPWLVTPLAALLFSLAHVPDLPLMAGTLCLGLAFTPLFLRYRNLWPLGLYHGWLGTLCYYLVLERDAFAETFG